MKAIFKFNVLAKLPDRLKSLEGLAFNCWFSWNHDAGGLFRRMDAELWESSKHNPVYMLRAISQQRLEELSEDAGFLAHMDRVYEDLQRYLSVELSPVSGTRDFRRFCIAYFSAEFGIAECLPIYSGGLGMLAGDYLKSCSDLNFPTVGVGLFTTRAIFSST